MTLYLSVCSDGTVSLWDTEVDRIRGAQDGETYVNLELTLVQAAQIDAAAITASVDINGRPRPPVSTGGISHKRDKEG